MSMRLCCKISATFYKINSFELALRKYTGSENFASISMTQRLSILKLSFGEFINYTISGRDLCSSSYLHPFLEWSSLSRYPQRLRAFTTVGGLLIAWIDLAACLITLRAFSFCMFSGLLDAKMHICSMMNSLSLEFRGCLSSSDDHCTIQL